MKKILKSKTYLIAAAAMALTASPLMHSAAYGGSVPIDISTGFPGVKWQVDQTFSDPYPYSKPTFAQAFTGPINPNPNLITASVISAGNIPGTWVPASGSSKWIGPDTYGGSSDGPGAFVYQLNLGSLAPGNYTISGETGVGDGTASSDNNFMGPDTYGDAIFTDGGTPVYDPLVPDGTVTSGTGNNNIQDFLLKFNVSGFVSTGTGDYLDFVVNNGTDNTGNGNWNPTGLISRPV